MSTVNRSLVLDTLIRHETLTIDDISKEENMGFVPNKAHLKLLLDNLVGSRHLVILAGVIPVTYTITNMGITEGKRLKD